VVGAAVGNGKVEQPVAVEVGGVDGHRVGARGEGGRGAELPAGQAVVDQHAVAAGAGDDEVAAAVAVEVEQLHGTGGEPGLCDTRVERERGAEGPGARLPQQHLDAVELLAGQHHVFQPVAVEVGHGQRHAAGQVAVG